MGLPRGLFTLTAQDADISEIKIEIDNSREVSIPVSLVAGESIKYLGGKTAVVYSPLLKKVKEIEINPEQFKLLKGAHSIVFDCVFSNKTKEPSAKFEVRIRGNAEEIKVNE